MESANSVRIGIISDTHGLLRPEAVTALVGVKLIIHAGDIDTPKVLEQLNTMAPVTVVRGNMDRGAWAMNLPSADLIEIEGVSIYVLHDLQLLDLDPHAAKINVIVNGHTHRPLIVEKMGILYFNPGSAGYRRNEAPLTVGILTIRNSQLYPEIINLGC